MSEKKKDSQKAAAKEKERSISRAKQEMTVSLLRYNKAVDHAVQQMADLMREFMALSPAFDGQRELYARAKMQERVMNSALKMVAGNRMSLWMIDDRALREVSDK